MASPSVPSAGPEKPMTSLQATEWPECSATEAPPVNEADSQESVVIFERLFAKHCSDMGLNTSPGPNADLQLPHPATDGRGSLLPCATSTDVDQLSSFKAEQLQLSDAQNASALGTTTTDVAILIPNSQPKVPLPSEQQDRRVSISPTLTAEDEISTPPIDVSSTGTDHAPRLPGTSQRPGQVNSENAPRRHAPRGPPLRRNTMELSQSPTQSNEGRSYDQYTHDESPIPRGTESPGHRTLHDNDTGAVKFEFQNAGSQMTMGDSFNAEFDAGSVGSTADQDAMSQPLDTAQSGFSSHHDTPNLAPETPAVVQRPFMFGSNADTNLIPPSQLFGQTQFTSGVKGASPTSSRPSPYIFNHNTISPNPPISSPLKDRGLRTSPTSHGVISSPPFLRPSSRLSENRQGQDEDDDHEDTVPSSPGPKGNHVSRNQLEPIEEYRPVQDYEPQNSSQGHSSDRGQSDSDSDSDFEDAARQRLARLKQSKAERSLTSITFPRTPPVLKPISSRSVHDGKREETPPAEDDGVEVPSTSRAKLNQSRVSSDVNDTTGKQSGPEHIPVDDTQETVANSQHMEKEMESVPVAHAETMGTTRDLAHTDCTMRRPGTAMADTIPETSPAGTATELPRTISGMSNENNTGNSLRARSLPPIPGSHHAQGQGPIPGDAQSSIPAAFSSQPPAAMRSSPPIIFASSQGPATRRSSRLKHVRTPNITRATQSPSDPGTRTSTLTSLSATPLMPSSITPHTENAVHEDVGQMSSPAKAKVERRSRPSSSAPKPLNQSHINISRDSSRRASSRLSRSSSIDVSTKSPSPGPVDGVRVKKVKPRKSIRHLAPPGPSTKESVEVPDALHGLFNGMVFAISFQSKQSGENEENYAERVKRSQAIERMIQEEGGMVLKEGFNSLFSFDSLRGASYTTKPELSSSVTLLAQDTGFTALIADGHSRKVKYMQALALGLPCLAPKWITTCIAKNKLVDWSPYLLCAGQSAYLGEAIRSRNLQIYDPVSAKLAEVFDRRPKLLDDTNILLVLKRSKDEEKRLPYVFLTQVLGASLSRVNNLEEARTQLLQREKEDRPYNWVYIGDKMKDVDSVLYGQGEALPKKRKRPSVAAAQSDRPPKKVRTLKDELVVQSLILGRLIEEDEMEV